MANEELIMKLSYLEQQSEETKKQIENVDEQTGEMESLKLSLQKIENKKNGEILANLGRGIFIASKIEDRKVFVNVGSKILVRKSLPDAVEIVDKQINELGEIRHQLMHNLEHINSNLQRLVEDARKEED